MGLGYREQEGDSGNYGMAGGVDPLGRGAYGPGQTGYYDSSGGANQQWVATGNIFNKNSKWTKSANGLLIAPDYNAQGQLEKQPDPYAAPALASAAAPATPLGPGPSLPYQMLTLSGYGNGQRGFGQMDFGRNGSEDFLRYLEGLRWQYLRGSMPQFNIFGRMG